jgi:Flp pilus assembly protein TadD
MRTRLAILGLLLALALPACAPTASVNQAMAAAEGGNLESARIELEKQRARNPGSAQVHMALGTVYYRIARSALERQHDEARYLAYFQQAVDELVTAAEIEPRLADAHLYLAAIDLYRGDLDGSLRGLSNARRLRGGGNDYTNLGELYVYRGDLTEARRWTLMGLRRGAGAGAVTFNQMLIHWREGDRRAAERDFQTLWKDYPEMLSTINMARVPREPDSFEEFAGYCCGSPGCGPYMRDACGNLGLKVQDRQISEQAALKELKIEMEKTRRLREIYRQRKELQVEVEDPKAAGTPEAPKASGTSEAPNASEAPKAP